MNISILSFQWFAETMYWMPLELLRLVQYRYRKYQNVLAEQTLCTIFCEIQEFPYFFTKCALYLYDKVAFSIAHNKTVRQHGVIDRMSVEW
jgi:hypothetical protein